MKIKYCFLLTTIIFLTNKNLQAQEYINPSGLDKFGGYWRYINGEDTITLNCAVRYLDHGTVFIKSAGFYYSYKQGASYSKGNIMLPLSNGVSDFGGTKPYGTNLDTLEFAGRDDLKKKTDEGYVVINAAGNQLKFVRDLEISGGGLRTPGLPGWTIPSGIIFTRYTVQQSPGD